MNDRSRAFTSATENHYWGSRVPTTILVTLLEVARSDAMTRLKTHSTA
jgi:hypothetical protein